MYRITAVHVAGPKLLAASLTAVLNMFPDIAAYEAVPQISAKDAATVGEPAPVLLVVLPEIPAAWSRPDGTPRLARLTPAQPQWVSPFDKFPTSRTALVLRGTAEELTAAKAAGFHVFVGIDDEPRIARIGVLAAARSEPYCSPTLAAKLNCGKVDRRARSDNDTSQGIPREALTKRQRNVATLAAAGFSNAEITAQLSISLPTVKTHLREAYKKLGIERRGQIPL